MAADQPERFEQVLDFGAEVHLFCLAQMEAGVRLPLVFEPAGCPEIVPADFFVNSSPPAWRRFSPP